MILFVIVILTILIYFLAFKNKSLKNKSTIKKYICINFRLFILITSLFLGFGLIFIIFLSMNESLDIFLEEFGKVF
ncbi:hypothetical protein LAL4801_06029 [Roseibium aggregatum]|uniref:Uncharacterized protein n=1 Tax=Roseibium aggregatum TaxID=187304 RepID=A0A0M6YE85_9HYPH|nr:hypothetical protein LAL4801_06029 [Roseibium aggregatum]